MRKRFLAALIPVLAAAGAMPARAEQSVDQVDKKFSQDALSVKAGESVTFTNSDQVAHDLSVSAPDGSHLPGHLQKPGDKVSITFDKPGEYKVRCLIHPKMKMTVTAQ